MKSFDQNFNLPEGNCLKGKRVILRHPLFDELKFINELWTDSSTMEAVGGIVQWDMTRLKAWYRERIDPGGFSDCYFLIFKEDLIPIGEVSFHRWNPEQRSADLNIKVLAKHRGNGYGSEALALFLKYFFETVEGELLVDDLYHSNKLGRNLMESLYFIHDPEFQEAYRMTMSRNHYFETLYQA